MWVLPIDSYCTRNLKTEKFLRYKVRQVQISLAVRAIASSHYLLWKTLSYICERMMKKANNILVFL